MAYFFFFSFFPPLFLCMVSAERWWGEGCEDAEERARRFPPPSRSPASEVGVIRNTRYYVFIIFGFLLNHTEFCPAGNGGGKV